MLPRDGMAEMGDPAPIWSARFNCNPPADAAAIHSFEAAADIKLPPDYVDFLRRTNGGVGFIGENYVHLWRIEELREFNRGYGADEFAPGLLLFGSDGGGEAFAFVKLSETYQVVMVPFTGLQMSDAVACGRDFDDFIQNLAKGPIWVTDR